MDYQKHYDALINRARNRTLDGYVEKHHVIPRCMNGTDDQTNIVSLTAEEHYIAHQLLVKIYPTNAKLIFAAQALGMNSNGNRPNNKKYGWLRRRASKLRTGVKRPQWVCDNISAATLGIPKPSLRGRVKSLAHRKTISDSKNKLLNDMRQKIQEDKSPLWYITPSGRYPSIDGVIRDYGYSEGKVRSLCSKGQDGWGKESKK